MKKLLLFLLTLLALTFSACDDDAPDYPDTKLLKGQWQLVEDGDNDNPLIYRFTTDGENTWSWGGLVTYYLLPDGTADFYRDTHGTFQILQMKKTENRVLNSLGMTLPTVTIYGMQRNII